MRWVAIVLAVMVILPRPVLGIEMGRLEASCACDCCHDAPDCGCQADRTPSVQSVADIQGDILVRALRRITGDIGGYFSFYCLNIERQIFHPPNKRV